MMLYFSIYKYSISLKLIQKAYKPGNYFYIYFGMYLSLGEDKNFKLVWDSL